MEGAQVLVGRVHALDHVAQAAHHAGALFGGVQEPGLVERGFQAPEEVDELRLLCRRLAAGGGPPPGLSSIRVLAASAAAA